MPPVKEQLRSEALRRVRNVGQAIRNPFNRDHNQVATIRRNWIGTENNINAGRNLGVLHNQLQRMPIDVTEGNDLKYIGMVAGRPPGNNKYPGMAKAGVDQTPQPPGMSLNNKYMPDLPDNQQRYADNSAFTKRTWTVVHESSHGILGTHDYRTYHAGNRGMTPQTYQSPPTSHKRSQNQPTGYKEDRKPGALQNWQDIKRDNADSWAGFVMNASQHIDREAATRIQRAVRARQATRNQAATLIQRAFRDRN